MRSARRRRFLTVVGTAVLAFTVLAASGGESYVDSGRGIASLDLGALSECLNDAPTTGGTFMDPRPGIIAWLAVESNRIGDDRADLPAVVAYGENLRQARARRSIAVKEAKQAWPVKRVTASGEDNGNIAWATIGPVFVTRNLEPDQDPAKVRARVQRRTVALIKRCLATAHQKPPAVAGWTTTDLGTLGGKNSLATAINARGEIVGRSETRSGATHAFLWRKGRMGDVGLRQPGFNSSIAVAINEGGQVAGITSKMEADGDMVRSIVWVWRNGHFTIVRRFGNLGNPQIWLNESGDIAVEFPRRAFVWQNASIKALPLEVTGMNNRGQIIGLRYGAGNSGPFGVVWYRGHTRDLKIPGSTYVSTVDAINNRGQILVCSVPDKSEGLPYVDSRPSVWKNGKATELETLHGAMGSCGDAINQQGEVVGYSTQGPPPTHERGVLWRGKQIVGLGTLGGTESRAVAINAKGQIIGYSSTRGRSGMHAFVWQNGKITDLGRATDAAAINDHGWIVGSMTTTGGDQHAVVWRPAG